MSVQDFQLGQAQEVVALSYNFSATYCAPGAELVKLRADILADAVAELTAKGCVPEAGIFELVGGKISTYAAKQNPICYTEQTNDMVTSGADNSFTEGAIVKSVEVGDYKPFGLELIDQDCNGCADKILADDFQITIAPDSAVKISVCIACYVEA